MTRAGPPTAGGGCRLRLQSAPISKGLALDGPRGFGLAGIGLLAFLEGMNGPADCGECGLVLARHGSRLNRRASAARHSAYGVVAEPLLHSGRELPQLGADRLVRGHAAPQRRMGVHLRWSALQEQLRTAERTTNTLAARMRDVMPDVMTAYPHAKVDLTPRGLLLKLSAPAVPKATVRGSSLVEA
jgi:hypothetical protein